MTLPNRVGTPASIEDAALERAISAAYNGLVREQDKKRRQEKLQEFERLIKQRSTIQVRKMEEIRGLV